MALPSSTNPHATVLGARAAGASPAAPASPASPSTDRWYPSTQQLRDTPSITAAFKQVLDQHYALQDAHAALLARVNAPTPAPSGPPPGSGPVDTQILGLRVAPVDVQSLADGATLKFNAANGNFEFS